MELAPANRDVYLLCRAYFNGILGQKVENGISPEEGMLFRRNSSVFMQPRLLYLPEICPYIFPIQNCSQDDQCQDGHCSEHMGQSRGNYHYDSPAKQGSQCAQ